MYVRGAVGSSVGEKVGISLGSIDGLVLVCDEGIKLGSTDGEVLCNTLGFADVIKLGADEGTDLGSSAGAVTGCSDSKLEGSLLGVLLGSSDGTQQFSPS